MRVRVRAGGESKDVGESCVHMCMHMYAQVKMWVRAEGKALSGEGWAVEI